TDAILESSRSRSVSASHSLTRKTWRWFITQALAAATRRVLKAFVIVLGLGQSGRLIPTLVSAPVASRAQARPAAGAARILPGMRVRSQTPAPHALAPHASTIAAGTKRVQRSEF